MKKNIFVFSGNMEILLLSSVIGCIPDSSCSLWWTTFSNKTELNCCSSGLQSWIGHDTQKRELESELKRQEEKNTILQFRRTYRKCILGCSSILVHKYYYINKIKYIDGILIHPSIHLSILYPSLCLSLYLSIHPSLHLFIHPSFSISISHPSISPSSIYIYINISIWLINL